MIGGMFLVGFHILKFPHYPRFFSAWIPSWLVNTLLWGALAAVLAANLYAHSRFPLDSLSWQNLRSPTSTTHTEKAKQLWQLGLAAAARREIKLADEFGGQVLGAVASPLEILSDWEGEPQRLSRELTLWKKIVAEKPDYPDAYLAAAAAAYKLSSLGEARALLIKAVALNPRHSVAKQLLNFLPGNKP